MVYVSNVNFLVRKWTLKLTVPDIPPFQNKTVMYRRLKRSKKPASSIILPKKQDIHLIYTNYISQPTRVLPCKNCLIWQFYWIICNLIDTFLSFIFFYSTQVNEAIYLVSTRFLTSELNFLLKQLDFLYWDKLLKLILEYNTKSFKNTYRDKITLLNFPK